MRHAYVIAPAALMLAFIGYFRWRTPYTPPLHVVGDALLSWRKPDDVARTTITLISGDEYEGRDGALEAAEDLRAGKVAFLGVGLAYPWHAELTEIWKLDYGVESRDLAGCFVTETLATYVSDYNRVMHAHIAARFGTSVSDVSFQKARALYSERHSKEK